MARSPRRYPGRGAADLMLVRCAEKGSVAKTIAEDGRTGIDWIRSPLCGGIEKSGNEDRLSSDIASADLSNLPLPDHRHRFETCQCSSGGSEPAEAEPRSDQTLDAPMILLDNIIQILALPETRTAPEFAVSLHLRDRPWIGGVLVDRERARIDGVRLRERLAEEPLRRSRIAPCSQQEVDRLPAAVHHPIEIHPTSLHPDIGLVHPPGAVAHPQMRADPLLKFLGIGLDPTEDRCVVDLDAAVEEHQFEIAVADGKHQIPTNRPQDHLRGELTPLEAIAATHSDIRPIQSGVDHTKNPPTSKFATEPCLRRSTWCGTFTRVARRNSRRIRRRPSSDPYGASSSKPNPESI